MRKGLWYNILRMVSNAQHSVQVVLGPDNTFIVAKNCNINGKCEMVSNLVQEKIYKLSMNIVSAVIPQTTDIQCLGLHLYRLPMKHLNGFYITGVSGLELAFLLSIFYMKVLYESYIPSKQ